MRILMAGGGTGGHTMPGIALAQKIMHEEPDSRVLVISSDRDLDVRTLNRYGLEAVHLSTQPFTLNPIALPKMLSSGFKAVRQAAKLLNDFAPDVAVGLGGFASFYPLIAAKLKRVPFILLEQNVIPGKATRRLAPFAAEIALQWQESMRHFSVKVDTHVTGNPIRPEITAVSRTEAYEKLHLDPDRKTLLVIGGSQGAHSLNVMMMESCGILADRAHNLQVVHLTGHADREQVVEAYTAAGIRAEVLAFLDDMGLAYRAADFALSRAGGTAIAELTACGVPAILVPYPHAADDHQLYNARALADSGAAVVLEESLYSPDRLVAMIGKFLDDPGLTKRMHAESLAHGKPEAAEEIYDILKNYAKQSPVNTLVGALKPEAVKEQQ